MNLLFPNHAQPMMRIFNFFSFGLLEVKLLYISTSIGDIVMPDRFRIARDFSQSGPQQGRTCRERHMLPIFLFSDKYWFFFLCEENHIKLSASRCIRVIAVALLSIRQTNNENQSNTWCSTWFSIITWSCCCPRFYFYPSFSSLTGYHNYYKKLKRFKSFESTKLQHGSPNRLYIISINMELAGR